MLFKVEFTITCLVSFVCTQSILCLADEAFSESSISNWTCLCTGHKWNQSLAIPANCSSSCDCSPGGSSRNTWKCICGADRIPEVSANSNNGSCFTSCNCSSGTLTDVKYSKKRISIKMVVIILLSSIIVTTLAITTILMCYGYRRDECATQKLRFSSDKEMSYNSATNLLSYRASSTPISKIYNRSPSNTISGFIHRASFLFRDKKRTIHGVITQFSYSDLETATSNFSNSNMIGIGGTSHVYCGYLRDGRTVAIKRIKAQRGPDAKIIFLTEIDLISRLNHCHVVPLLGYCLEHRGKHAEMLLVFQYMANGNLRECLDGTSGKHLAWGTRIAIAIGAARGLEYLHEAAAPRILHSDVKSTNILLDENWRAKITDLGMAKSLRIDGLPSCSSSPARMQGTFGYFAPEYAIVGRASLKSDVFSFGVVLLELISGRHPIYKSADKADESLVIWATPRLQDSRQVIQELPDPRLEGNFQEEEMQIMAYLAKECLLLDPDSRPTMSEVVQVLSTIVPEKSRRRNFSVELFQSSFSSAMNIGMDKGFDRDSAVETNKKDAVSEDFTTSNARSCPPQDDDSSVDVTEPHLESFCVSDLGPTS